MIREYRPEDLDALREMHREQSLGYSLPDLADPIFLTRLVEEEGGEVGAAIFVRLTSEGYLIARAGGDPRARWERLVALHQAARLEAHQRGLADVHCWLPPRLEKSFGRRLGQLGWQKALWPCYVLELEEAGTAATAPESGSKENQNGQGG